MNSWLFAHHYTSARLTVPSASPITLATSPELRNVCGISFVTFVAFV